MAPSNASPAHISRPGDVRPGGVRPDGGPPEELWVAHLGRVGYRDGVGLQERLRSGRGAGHVPDALLLLEHPPVYTKGRRATGADLPMSEPWYRGQGIDVADTDRGGRVTYHGPGQLVGYPVMAIGDVVAYLRTMEAALIAALGDEGIAAQVREGLTGVWVGDRKIGSIGVHISRGVTTHGFALNVDNDLRPFDWIVPCGIEHVQMTSVSEESSRTRAMPCFRKRVAWRFAEAFVRRQRLVSLERLLAAAESGAEAASSPREPVTA